jgi:hypothetical protein
VGTPSHLRSSNQAKSQITLATFFMCVEGERLSSATKDCQKSVMYMVQDARYQASRLVI